VKRTLKKYCKEVLYKLYIGNYITPLHARKYASIFSDKHSLLCIFILLLVLFIPYFINNFGKCFKVLRKEFNVLYESYFYKIKLI